MDTSQNQLPYFDFSPEEHCDRFPRLDPSKPEKALKVLLLGLLWGNLKDEPAQNPDGTYYNKINYFGHIGEGSGCTAREAESAAIAQLFKRMERNAHVIYFWYNKNFRSGGLYLKACWFCQEHGDAAKRPLNDLP